MKKFLIIICLFFFVLTVIIASIRFSWINKYPLVFENNFIDSFTNTIVLGPSNGVFAWNDTIIPFSRNLCGSANSLGACYNILKWSTEYKRVQADTIIICASFVAMVYNNDDEILFNLQNWNEERKNILNYNSFFYSLRNKWEYWEYLLFRFPVVNFYNNVGYDGYQHSDRNQLHHPMLFRQINRIIETAGGGGGFSESFLRSYCSFQIEFLKRIKEYCNEHKKTLIVLSTPVYKIPDMIDDSGYYSIIRSELGDSALIADYSRFEFPDSTYYADLEHLNSRGAEYFSKHIAQNGLELKYAIDYCK